MRAVVLFDGPCTLCNKSVQWIFQRDRDNLFLFASLKSEWAQVHLSKELKSENSVVLFQDDKFYTRSQAILLILAQLPGYKWTQIFGYLPSWSLDIVYKLIAKTRYRIFGKGFCALLPEERIIK
ncbi:MAG: DUF393 domain-containing protein [Bacteroidota bacterium]|nr:DUF393 domain-containing protein [Bacteroidota bacterium]